MPDKSVRTVQVDDAEVMELLKKAQLPSGRKASGISKTVVAAASGVIPSAGAMPTFVFETDDGSESMVRFMKLYIEAYNEFFLQAMKEAAVPDTIYVAHSVFTNWNYDPSNCDPNSAEFQESMKLIHAPLPLADAPLMTVDDYRPDEWHSLTPLCDAIQSTIHAAIGYTEKLRQRGKTMKTILIWLSDGQENASVKATPATIKADMNRLMELKNITPVFVGFAETPSDEVYFKQFTKACGFPDGNVMLVPQPQGPNSAKVMEEAKKRLRRIFGTLSQQVVSSSQQTVSPNDQFLSDADVS